MDSSYCYSSFVALLIKINLHEKVEWKRVLNPLTLNNINLVIFLYTRTFKS